MTTAISRPATGFLADRFTALGVGVEQVEIPDYPIPYDAGKSLHSVTKAAREFGYGAQ